MEEKKEGGKEKKAEGQGREYSRGGEEGRNKEGDDDNGNYDNSDEKTHNKEEK